MSSPDAPFPSLPFDRLRTSEQAQDKRAGPGEASRLGERGPHPPPGDADGFVERVLDVVENIPPGRVMTYGDVAAVLGSRAARAVGGVMARYGSDVPWWRVVRAGGHPPRCHEDSALIHYRAERTPLISTADAYRIDMPRARHWP